MNPRSFSQSPLHVLPDSLPLDTLLVDDSSKPKNKARKEVADRGGRAMRGGRGRGRGGPGGGRGGVSEHEHHRKSMDHLELLVERPTYPPRVAGRRRVRQGKARRGKTRRKSDGDGLQRGRSVAT
ncbi:hypothetical protein B0T24DRAFT_591758 [Lasiosphaeria ovina]|uniref:Uncharacterized protein n=1 Tax=Lasiosphaeria ovina TaxID=92902 RepID=A0AAE0KH59_9PEZI|nr:hypothetical protein B0T24DRAFT_591758 [Lasiosphaeria ovina]